MDIHIHISIDGKEHGVPVVKQTIEPGMGPGAEVEVKAPESSFAGTVPADADKQDASSPHPAKDDLPSWGGVSLEDNENSYIGQWGRYSCIDKSRWTGKEEFVSAGLHYALSGVTGRILSSLPIPGDIQRYLALHPIRRLFSTAGSIAALVDTGAGNRLMIWGNVIFDKERLVRLDHVRDVYCNETCFAVIYDEPVDGRWIATIGPAASGGAIPDELHVKLLGDRPVSIRCSKAAFAVITLAGKVYAWGSATDGGNIPTDVSSALSRESVTKLTAASQAFCAITADGTPYAWGKADGGGNLPVELLGRILADGGAASVVAAQNAFCCITRERGTAHAWGHATYGGNLTGPAATLAERGQIAACKAAAWGFCIATSSGQIQAWGSPAHGGTLGSEDGGIANRPSQDADVTEAYSILFDRPVSLATKGNGAGGTDTPVTGRYRAEEWDLSILAADSAFCVLLTDKDGRIRNVQTWGLANVATLSDAARMVLLAGQLKFARASNGAFLVVLESSAGDMPIVWGDPRAGGTLAPEAYDRFSSNVTAIDSLNTIPISPPPANPTLSSGFVARLADGTVVSWRSNEAAVVAPGPS